MDPRAGIGHAGGQFHFWAIAGNAHGALRLLPVMPAITGAFVWSLATSFSRKTGIGVAQLSSLPIEAFVPLAYRLLKRYQHDSVDLRSEPFVF